MTMTVISKLSRVGDVNYYTDGFRNIVETHLNYLVNHVTTEPRSVEVGVAWRHKGDFDALLRYMGIPDDLFWVTMRMNGYTSPTMYDGDKQEILVPARDTLNLLAKRFQQRNTIL